MQIKNMGFGQVDGYLSVGYWSLWDWTVPTMVATATTTATYMTLTLDTRGLGLLASVKVGRCPTSQT